MALQGLLCACTDTCTCTFFMYVCVERRGGYELRREKSDFVKIMSPFLVNLYMSTVRDGSFYII